MEAEVLPHIPDAIYRYEYEESDFLKAVKEGEWILLDGIENAPTEIIEKLTLLCGDKPELNLYESGQESIIPKEGFHLFMTYNPERLNHTESLPSILLDKCLIYYLDSFLNNEQALSQIIYGYLVNSNYLTNEELIVDISSRISNIHNKIIDKLKTESDKISERTIINFCKNWTLDYYKNHFPILLKNNFLHFYFPSNDINIFNNLINETIKGKVVNFVSLANNFNIECKVSLKLLNILKQNIKGNNIYKFELGKFIFSCLDIHFEYLEKIEKEINEVVNEADKLNYKGIYLPLKTFVKYLDEIGRASCRERV